MHMDPHHHIPDNHPSMVPSYGFYADHEPAFLGYSTAQINNNFNVHAPPPRNHLNDLHHQHSAIQSYHQYPLLPPHQYQGVAYTASPPHGNLPISTSPPSPSPDLYEPLSPPVSGSDTSADGLYHHSNSSGANSPTNSSRGTSLVHRHLRCNPTPSPTTTNSSFSGGRRRSNSHDSDEDNDMGSAYVEMAHSRKEATRRQRIEAEQRRRDELRDGYAKLKEVLPVSNQKSSKVSLLERATNHIIALEKANAEMQMRLSELEAEMEQLRAANEKISLGTGQPLPYDDKSAPPLSDGIPVNLCRNGQPPSSEGSSPSASEGGAY